MLRAALQERAQRGNAPLEREWREPAGHAEGFVTAGDADAGPRSPAREQNRIYVYTHTHTHTLSPRAHEPWAAHGTRTHPIAPHAHTPHRGAYHPNRYTLA